VINRSQALVLGFFAAVIVLLAAILILQPDIYAQALQTPPEGGAVIEVAFFLAITAFIALIAVGVLRRWRWLFWLIVVAFLAGVLRIPASILELAGIVPAAGPGWYVVLQGLLGAIQVAIALALLAGYRRAGAWGGF
jgi:hypothetical protein